MNRRMKDESGMAIVEAAIYLPIVIGIVFLFVYVALFYMEEYAMFYVVERAANETARETAYQGYTQLGMNENNTFEFSWSGDTPSKKEVTAYYQSRHGQEDNTERSSLKSLYWEFTGLFGKEDYSETESKYYDILKNISMISVGTITTPEIEVERSLLSTNVVVTVSHSFRTPAILQFLGLKSTTELATRTKKLAICPVEFVRNVDLGTDLVEFLLEKFDKNGTFKSYISKGQEILKKIL